MNFEIKTIPHFTIFDSIKFAIKRIRRNKNKKREVINELKEKRKMFYVEIEKS